jgi:hypothetical protein
MSAETPKALVGTHWFHSHEEDGPDDMVFRPDSYPMPPSRGRSSFELHQNGSMVRSMPGPTDVRSKSAGRWRIENGNLLLSGDAGTKPTVYKLKTVEPDRLVVERPQEV